IVMSDSEDFTITYTEVSSPFEDLSDIGSPRVDGLPMLPEDPYAYMVTAFKAPPSPDYVPGPKEPEQAPPLPEFVLEPVYPEFIPPEDEDEEDLEEDPEEDSEKNPADYPANKGDDDDESSEDDEDDDDNDVEEDKDGEEEGDHPALANSVPPPVHRVTARMFVRAQTPISLPLDIKVARVLAIPTPPPPPLSPFPTYPLGYRAVMIRLRAETPFTSQLLQSSTPPSGTPPLLPIPLTTPSPPLLLPSTIFRAVHLLPLLDPLEALDQTMDSLALWMMRLGETPTEMLVMGLQIHRTKWLRTCRGHQLLMSGQLNMLRRDRRAHARTARLIETEARLSHKGWVQSMDASDTAHSEMRALHTSVLAHQTEIAGLRAVDRTRQVQLMETLTLMRTLQTQKMAPKRTTRSTPATTTTLTTSVTDKQLKRLIDQGVANALAARDAKRSRNGEDNHDSGTGVRRQAPPACECTYPDFMKCKPLYFKGTEGVIKVKGTDVVGYNQRFQELALLCDRMFPEESDKIEKYVGGLPDMIHESVIASMLKTMQDAIEFATELMDKKIRTFAERQSENKRKQDDNQ
ncbi:hypothetical protein Tco_1233100, partial [Tanacetum coccineum]